MHSSSSSDSCNKILKRLHNESYKIINDAIVLDENTNSLNEKTKAISLYKKGLEILDKALNLKFKEELPEKAKTLIVSMEKNQNLVKDRLDILNKEKLKSNSKTQSLIKKNNLTTNQKPCIRYKNSLNESPKKIDNSIKPDLNKSLISLKGVDKKLINVILDNIYQPDTKISFKDISGLALAKQTLKEIVVLPLLRPEIFTGLRTPAKGVMFFGPPGNGKTLIAKAVANESNATFLSITASSLTSKWLGESEKLVKALFSVARELQPCIIFIDEIDSLLCERKENESEATRRIKTEFFVELDGLRTENDENVFVMAATNRPFELDDAALRRFPKRIFINLPELNARKELLLKLLSQQKNLLSVNEVQKLAELTEGYSASDLTALAKDAALGPIRELNIEEVKNMNPNKIRKITYEDFLNSIKKIRKSCIESSIEKLEKWNKEYGDVSL